MWILPKQLHTLASVQVTEALSLDLNESSQLCAQSLFVRSKPSLLRTWLQKWKRDSWTQHLFGRILRPSLGKAFEIEWTSLLVATPASHFPQQASVPVKTTLDICGLGSQMELLSCDQESAFLKTSKDTSALDSEKLLQTWKALVTQRRGAYSARLNAVRLTSAKECSSWPTATTRDWKDTGDMSQSMIRKDGKERMDTLGRVVQANHSTHGSRLGLSVDWRTPQAQEAGARVETLFTKDGAPAMPGQRAYRKTPSGKLVLQSQTINQQVEMVQNWMTPRACEAQNPPMGVDKRHHGLTHQVTKQWATPQSKDHKSGHRDPTIVQYKQLNVEVEAKATGKLNPRWVETLMGLPVGWTMPSCQSPVTIVPTSCASLAMESSQPQQH